MCISTNKSKRCIHAYTHILEIASNMPLFMKAAQKMTLSAAGISVAGKTLMRWVINNNDSAFAFQGAVTSGFLACSPQTKKTNKKK